MKKCAQSHKKGQEYIRGRKKESVILRIAVCKHSLKSTEVKLTISASARETYGYCIQV